MIKATVVADSKNEWGDRITTMVVTFPRIILAEFNTHRMFSRNSASSRAIPFEKMVKSVEENPFIPIAWQKDHKGMQGTEYFTDNDNYFPNGQSYSEYGYGSGLEYNKEIWLQARNEAVKNATLLNNNKVTKQLANRLLEPFMWHTVIITSSEFSNFFALRCPQYLFEPDEKLFRSWKDMIKYHNEMFEDNIDPNKADILFKLKQNKGQAEIHMMALAEAMWDAYNESTPKDLKAGEYHIPFGDTFDSALLIKALESDMPEVAPINERDFNDPINQPVIDKLKVKIATARCARISYTVVGEEGKSDNYEADIKLHDRLLASGHMSPFEHCGKCMSKEERDLYVRGELSTLDHSRNPMAGHFDVGVEQYAGENIKGWSGNFRGFIQYRKIIPNENRV